MKKQKKRQVIDFDAQEEDNDFLKKPTKKTKKIPSFEDKDGNDQSLVQLGSALDILKAEGVDVSFLPDKHRDEKKKQLEQQAAEEWEKMQQKIREEPLHITFSYYNGTGHRFEVTIKKGDSVLQFLAAAHKVITAAGHSDIRRLPPEAMIYVKEDLILPHHYTFYDFFLTNARGKSGSLVNFGVQDDVRLKGDARLEKNDAHAGKVMSRDYYNKHKHIFPLTRFEQYDPKKTYDKYTIA